jgi:hypothetical protein
MVLAPDGGCAPRTGSRCPATVGGLSYTPYRGAPDVRRGLAEKVGGFLGIGVDRDLELLITPGSQVGLFLAVGSLVNVRDDHADGQDAAHRVPPGRLAGCWSAAASGFPT